VWRGAAQPEAYEWWYFDAVSESGRDLLVIIFLTNFIFSPRYNRQASDTQKKISQPPGASSETQTPAIAFTLYRDGRPCCAR
jgi:carotenoid 1,2-hydratase